MAKNSDKSDKAQVAMCKLTNNLRWEILNSLGEVYEMMQEIDNLNDCDTIEEIEEVMDNLSKYKHPIPSLDSLLEDQGVDSLEEALMDYQVEVEERDKYRSLQH